MENMRLPNWLDRIQEIESAKAEQILASLNPQGRSVDWGTTYLLFYPELHGIATANYSISGPLWIHMLLAPVLTVPVHPFNPVEFEIRYGFDVRTFLRFVDDGLLIPIIDSDIHRYRHRAYLRDILTHERTIATSVRDRYAFHAISASYFDVEVECLSWTNKIDIRLLDDGLRGSLADWKRWYGKKTGDAGLRKATAVRMARLMALHPELTVWLSSLTPSLVITETNLRSIIETQPVTKGLGGLYQTTERAAHLVAGSGVESRDQVLRSVSRFITWRHVCRDLRLDFPETISISDLRTLLASEVVASANSLLDELLTRVQRDSVEPVGLPAATLDPLVTQLVARWQDVARVARALLKADDKAHTLARAVFSLVPGNINVLAETILKDRKQYENLKGRLGKAFSDIILYPDRLLQGRAVWSAYRYMREVEGMRNGEGSQQGAPADANKLRR
jgi:hypothetical protein